MSDIIQITDKRGQKKAEPAPQAGPPPWWDVFIAVEQERKRQIEKWGVQHHPDGTSQKMYGGWADEYKRQNDARHEAGKPSMWSKVLLEEVFEALSETDEEKLAYELVQSAAVIVAWLEDIASRSPQDAA